MTLQPDLSDWLQQHGLAHAPEAAARGPAPRGLTPTQRHTRATPMATLLFYEKPGCGGNARQRALLEDAGHTLQRRNLLTTPWTRDSLLAWLSPLPVADWFNRAAPRIKSGELVPEALDTEAALAALLAEPLLIRRPLMQRDDGARLVGFDLAAVQAFVGLASPARGSLEGCAAAASRPAGTAAPCATSLATGRARTPGPSNPPPHKAPPCPSTTTAAPPARPSLSCWYAPARCPPARTAATPRWNGWSRASRRPARSKPSA